jgi:hypothetical protein
VKGDGDHEGQTLELLTTILLAAATILTAWSAFQATKWSGVQANSYSQAGALRVESAKENTRFAAQGGVDAQTFLQWITALGEERAIDPTASQAPDGSYEPAPESASGFIYLRMRDEFKPAIHEWVALRPLDNPDAPETPFDMPSYRPAAQRDATRLTAEAEATAAVARQANQRGDNYVMLTVVFASVLFFDSLSTKLNAPRNQWIMFGFATLLILAGIVTLLTFPVEV